MSYIVYVGTKYDKHKIRCIENNNGIKIYPRYGENPTCKFVKGGIKYGNIFISNKYIMDSSFQCWPLQMSVNIVSIETFNEHLYIISQLNRPNGILNLYNKK